MKKILTLLIALMSFVAVEAQEHSILIYESSFMPESGLAIDKIGQDPSKRDCARIKMHINRMTSTEIDQLKVETIGGIVKVTKQYVSLEGDGLIVELTAKPSTRFFLHHDKYGDSNEVVLNLEGNKEYRLSAELKVFYSIAISCDAKEAEVYIDDAFQGRISDDYTLTVKDVVPGTHELRVQSGTSVVKRDIEVNSDSIYFRVEVNETPSLPQYVLFNVTPKDAIVVVNNKSYSTDAEGVAQAKLYNGQYTYHASAPGYHDAKDTFTVNGEKVEININLKPAHGWVYVESTTALQGASVYIDGVRIGNAPIKSNKLASGKHTIKILKDLYEPYEDTITIKDGETLKYTPTLTANFATVTVTTSEGADIYIDNKKKGTTTWTGDLETGLYVFEARKANHTPTQLPKEITAQPQKQKITLNAPKPIMGSIDITSKPTKASVYIDSKYVGETPLMTDFMIGSHEVSVKKNGYQTNVQTVFIEKSKIKDINVELNKITGDTNGYEWVDLGLSVKWATCNVGATKPEQYGDYFAWGETLPKRSYTEAGSATYGKNMEDFTGNPLYDTASANWGDGWRMPTKSEIQELKNKCSWEWVAVNGINGYRVTGPNGKSIFLPAAGYCSGTLFGDVGSLGRYGCSTPYDGNDIGAYYLYFDNGNFDVYWSNRQYGRSVRPVIGNKVKEKVTEIADVDDEDDFDVSYYTIENVVEEIVEEEIFFTVEEMPTFRGGGLPEFRNWVQKEVKYPQIARENGIQGNVVVRFVVGPDGKMTNFEVLQSPDKTLSDATIEVLKKANEMKKGWKPGKQRGKPVKVSFTLPVAFKIQI